ncbi:MAG: GIY-YIG nuclease family protein [Leptolyngbyaceae cyanobacterium SL_5_14]|nr:GIY-YIG nuclease family protein [Leptolyngbyaceae cyanobacterium SL_5_14]NJO66153.1 GIY-YIG nuclease family protein [Leptolyngbyaceae cyanobacterium RM1_405_57]
MTIGIYLITNVVTGDRYVGLSTELESRRKTHLHQLAKGTHQNKAMQKLAKEHGVESFIFEVLEVYDNSLKPQTLEELEVKWIKKLKPELNFVHTERRKRWTDEQRKKLSETQKERWRKRKEKQ